VPGDAEQAAHAGDALLERMHAQPHGPEAELRRRDQQILRGGGAVLFPVLRPALKAAIAADEDGQRRFGRHRRIGMHLRDGLEQRALPDHDELPGLLVAGGRRRHGRAQQALHVLVRHRLGRVLADAEPPQDGVVHRSPHE